MDAAHHNKYCLSDIVYGIPLIVGILIDQLIWNLSYERFIPSVYVYLFAAISLVFSLYLILAAKHEFKKYNQPSEPALPSTQLVTSGVYQRFRNPMYISLTFLLFGISFLFDIPILFVLNLIACSITHYYFILPEERYLENKFSDDFRQYKKNSRRWI